MGASARYQTDEREMNESSLCVERLELKWTRNAICLFNHHEKNGENH